MNIFKAIAETFAALKEPDPLDIEATGIFFFGPPPSQDQIIAQAEAIAAGVVFEKSVTEEGKQRLNLSWPDVSVMITIDPNWDKAIQIEGMRGWISRFPAKEKAREVVKTFIASLDNTVTCYGSVITPTFDVAEGKVVRLLKEMLAETDGFFYSRNTFYRATGERITGFAEDPFRFGGEPEPAATIK